MSYDITVDFQYKGKEMVEDATVSFGVSNQSVSNMRLKKTISQSIFY